MTVPPSVIFSTFELSLPWLADFQCSVMTARVFLQVTGHCFTNTESRWCTHYDRVALLMDKFQDGSGKVRVG